MNIVDVVWIGHDLVDLEGPDPEDVLWLVEKQVREHFGVK